ncbi:hypothetical protein [Rathayibacter soli]|uniref:hypothetical protein n=1 Tax=Rathayibacter soli TaxID=3144168 RepID=UPI0027E4F06F|nr:hypothetical protein [Glaciibacter superstes]
MTSHTNTSTLRISGLTVTRRATAHALIALALALGAVGCVLPWLTVFNGLTIIPGFSVDGGFLAAIMLAAVAVLYVADRHGGARVLQSLAGIAAGGVLVDSVYSAIRIQSYASAPGVAGALTTPVAGVGPYFMAAGALVLIAAVVLAPAASGSLGARIIVRLVLALLLLSAASIHLILTSEHLAESTILGAGFLAAGIAQLALAGLVIVGPPGVVDGFGMSAIIVVNVALIGIYIYAVTVGLPLDTGHGADEAVGLRIGAGEPIDIKGGVDLIAEVAAVVLAGVLGWRRSWRRDETTE